MNLPRPDVILTHESDLDGFVSGLLLQRLAARLFGAPVRLEAWNYNGWRNRPMTEAAAWVCDLPFETRLDRPNWLIVDHHLTAVQPQKALLVHDLNRSAGRLCYDLCCQHGLGSPELDRLVRLNDVGDLYLDTAPEFLEALDYGSLVKSYNFWNLHAVINGRLEALLDHPLLEVMAVRRRVEDPIGLEWSREHITAINPEVAFVQTVVGNANQIVHLMLARRITPHAVLATAFQKSNGQVVVSFRSRGGEAIRVAEQLKGGGHANAAGATLPRSVQSLPDAVQYLKQVLAAPPAAPGQGGGDGLNSLDRLLSGLALPPSSGPGGA